MVDINPCYGWIIERSNQITTYRNKLLINLRKVTFCGLWRTFVEITDNNIEIKENTYLLGLFLLSCLPVLYLAYGNGTVEQELFMPLDKLVMSNPSVDEIGKQVPNIVSAVKKITAVIIELF